MIVIGERINASNASVGDAIAKRDSEFIRRLALDQVEAGADFIDINSGVGYDGGEEVAAAMEWLVNVVQSATDKPLSIDNASPEVIQAGIDKYRGDKLIINSVTAEPKTLDSIGTLAVENQAWLVALAMGNDGIPQTVEKRLEACDMIMDHLSRLGVKNEQIYLDPLVLPVAVYSDQGPVILETLRQIKSRYPGTRTVLGLSNISWGLPGRKPINRAFLAAAICLGLDAAILNPLDRKLMSFIIVAETLAGRDNECRRYMRAYRRGIIPD